MDDEPVDLVKRGPTGPPTPDPPTQHLAYTAAADPATVPTAHLAPPPGVPPSQPHGAPPDGSYGVPPAHPYYGAPPMAPPTDGMAVVALVAAIAAGPVAIPFAHGARSRIARTGRGGRGMATTALAIGYSWLGAAAGFAVAFAVFLAVAGSQGYQPISRAAENGVVSTAPQSSVTQAPGAAPGLPARLSGPPAGASPCARTAPEAAGYNQSATGTTITSCEFAESVRVAYATAGAPGTARDVVAYSPVTQQSYTMRCLPSSDVVVCRGGNDAVVFVYAS